MNPLVVDPKALKKATLSDDTSTLEVPDGNNTVVNLLATLRRVIIPKDCSKKQLNQILYKQKGPQPNADEWRPTREGRTFRVENIEVIDKNHDNYAWLKEYGFLPSDN